MSVSSISIATNSARPISAEAVNAEPNPPVNVRSMSDSTIQAKPATSSRWIVRITNARRPRIRPRSSLTPMAVTPPNTSRMAPKRRWLPMVALIAGAIRWPSGGGGAAGTGSCAVTWRNSSSRSLAAREKVAIAEVRRDGGREQAGRPLVVAVEADLDRAVLEQVGGHDVRLGGEPGARGLEGVVVAEDADAEHRADAQPPLDVGDAAVGEHLAAVDDRDRGAQLLELGEDVRRDEDRLAQRAQLAEELAQLDPGPRVEPGRRLVEEQDLAGRGRACGRGTAAAACRARGPGRTCRAWSRGPRARAGRRSSAGGGRPGCRSSGRRSRGTPRPSCRRRPRSCPA